MLVSGDVYHSPILFTWYAFPLWKLTLQVSRSTLPESFKEGILRLADQGEKRVFSPAMKLFDYLNFFYDFFSRKSTRRDLFISISRLFVRWLFTIHLDRLLKLQFSKIFVFSIFWDFFQNTYRGVSKPLGISWNSPEMNVSQRVDIV